MTTMDHWTHFSMSKSRICFCSCQWELMPILLSWASFGVLCSMPSWRGPWKHLLTPTKIIDSLWPHTVLTWHWMLQPNLLVAVKSTLEFIVWINFISLLPHMYHCKPLKWTHSVLHALSRFPSLGWVSPLSCQGVARVTLQQLQRASLPSYVSNKQSCTVTDEDQMSMTKHSKCSCQFMKLPIKSYWHRHWDLRLAKRQGTQMVTQFLYCWNLLNILLYIPSHSVMCNKISTEELGGLFYIIL